MTSSKDAPIVAPSVESVLLGGISSGFAATLTNPLEVVKTRLQLQQNVAASAINNAVMKATQSAECSSQFVYKGFIDCFQKIYKNEGLVGLQSGVAAFVSYYLFFNGARLGTYDYFHQVVSAANKTSGENPSHSTLVMNRFLAGACAGACGVAVGNPFSIVKTRHQLVPIGELSKTETGAVRKTKGFGAVASDLYGIVRHEGFFGLWRGFTAALPRVVLASGTQLSVYETTKSALIEHDVLGDTVYNHIVSSSLATVVFTLAMSPLDVVTSRLYVQNMNGGKGKQMYSNALDCTLKLFKQEGVGAFWKGWTPLFLRFVPHTVIMMGTWEQLKKLVAAYREAQR